MDCAGKSTQIDFLKQHLSHTGKDPVYLWTRGGYTPAFTWLKKLMRKSRPGQLMIPTGLSEGRTKTFEKAWVRQVWLMIALCDLLCVYGLWIRWWRMQKRPVICDRYLWDTLIDFRLTFPQESVETWLLWRLLEWATPTPDVAFLLLVPVEESVRRSQCKDEPFPDTAALRAQRLTQYQKLSSHVKWIQLDGLLPTHEIADAVRLALK
jgi:thymidylate kinase